MTPLERAARAVCERGWDGSPGYKWENISAAEKDEYRRDARAVLQAIREPSERMADAAIAEDSEDLRAQFRAMIDAALSNGT